MVVIEPDKIGDADFANYFCTYGYLYHQKDMLEDQARMTAYHNAVRLNPRQFKDKVVLDVGTGSGILAIWAAQWRKKVYAVEATYMAKHARALIKANGLDGVIEVLQSTVEEVELPEKVDVIISEWMGFSSSASPCSTRSSSLATAGSRRGRMFPSHAKMYLAPIRTQTSAKKREEFEDSCVGWDEFADRRCRTTASTYDRSPRRSSRSRGVLPQHQRVGGRPPVAGARRALRAPRLRPTHRHAGGDAKPGRALQPSGDGGGWAGGPAEVGAFCGWFDVSFKGSSANPNETDVELTTAPDANGATHWGQQAFYLDPTLSAADGNVIAGRLELKRKAENQRLYDLRLTWKQGADEGGFRGQRDNRRAVQRVAHRVMVASIGGAIQRV